MNKRINPLLIALAVVVILLFAPTFSPRASSANVMKLAFIRNGDVYIYSMDTGEARKLTNSGNVTAVDARSDGFIVYATWQDTGMDEVTFTIETINADASSWREVKRWTESIDWEPIDSISVSPVRNTVVFTYFAHQLSDFCTSIWSVDLDTGQEQRLTDTPSNGSTLESYCYASFSPTGDRLVLCLA